MISKNTAAEATSDRLLALNEILNTGAMKQAAMMLNNLHPAEIADLLESLPLTKRKFIWSMVDDEHDGEVLLELGDEVRNTLVSDLDKEEILNIIEGLDMDDTADFLLSLPETLIRETLLSMDKQYLEQIENILSYPEDSAGGLMDLDFITVRANVTLEVVLRYLRRRDELPEKTDCLMVVDRNNCFLGTLLIRKILVHAPDTLVYEIMDREEDPMPVDMSAHEVAQIFRDHDLTVAPVVNEQNQLLGRITIDDVVDVIVEEAEKSVRNMAGLNEDEDIFSPIIKSTRRRSLWLGANLLTAFIASWVIGLFEATIKEVVALAILMPIVASMGGIAGSQTLTLVIRAQALGQIGLSNFRFLLSKELAVGTLNSCLWAIVVGCVSTFWFNDPRLGGVIACALIINLFIAALAGVCIPLLLSKLNIDPALAGGVILTTITDVIGFMSFLGIATLLLI